jgi:hypothetical protein
LTTCLELCEHGFFLLRLELLYNQIGNPVSRYDGKRYEEKIWKTQRQLLFAQV